MTLISPGPDGTPLPSGEWVIRMPPKGLNAEAIEQLKNGRAHESMFILSSTDRTQANPRLSVWAERLTTVSQLVALTQTLPSYGAILRMNVDKIRALRPMPENPPHPGLDVEWEQARSLDAEGNRTIVVNPGAEGHAGIARLDMGAKSQRKDLRSKLAEPTVAFVRKLSESELQDAHLILNQ